MSSNPLYIEKLVYNDSVLLVEYSVEPPEPDVGIRGGVVVEHITVVQGPSVDIEEAREELALEIWRDLYE